MVRDDMGWDSVPEWYHTLKGLPNKETLEQMLRRKITPSILKKGCFTMENTPMELQEYSFIMKLMVQAVERTIAKGTGGKADYDNPEFRMLMQSSADCSLKGMKINGAMNNYLLDGLLAIANGNLLKGLGLMLKRH